MVAMNVTDASGDYATADYQIMRTPILSEGSPHHLVVTFSDPGASSNKTLTLYVDGTQLTSPAVPPSVSGTDNRLSSLDDRNVWIGRSNYSNATFAGSFDEFRIYNAALSASQVAASRTAGPD
jgi:Concanavalin A-like lectin/glucanases superfamily